MWLVGEPFIDTEAAARLERYVQAGGILVVSRAWPATDLRGNAIEFLKEALPAREDRDGARRFHVLDVGAGKVAWCADALAACESGAEDTGIVSETREFVKSLIGPPAVDATTPVVRYKTWQDGGGSGSREEPRNLVEATLHEGGGARILYVANVHERAVKATVTLAATDVGRLVEIGGGKETIEVDGASAVVDMDRKSVRAFRVCE